jgi:hypothetical protein
MPSASIILGGMNVYEDGIIYCRRMPSAGAYAPFLVRTPMEC